MSTFASYGRKHGANTLGGFFQSEETEYFNKLAANYSKILWRKVIEEARNSTQRWQAKTRTHAILLSYLNLSRKMGLTFAPTRSDEFVPRIATEVGADPFIVHSSLSHLYIDASKGDVSQDLLNPMGSTVELNTESTLSRWMGMGVTEGFSGVKKIAMVGVLGYVLVLGLPAIITSFAQSKAYRR